MPLNWRIVSGSVTDRTISVRPMIAQPQLPPTTLCTPTRICLEERDQRPERALDDVGKDHRLGSQPRCALARPTEQALRAHRIQPAGAERVAPQQPPAGEHESAKYAELADRLYRVVRAARRVAAARPEQRREHALVERAAARRRARAADAPHDARPAPWRPALRAPRRRPPGPRVSPSSRAGARATSTMSCPAGSASAWRDAGLAQQPLQLVALDRAADLAPDREADARRLVAAARKRVEHEIAVGDRAALAVDAVELRAARQSPGPPRAACRAPARPRVRPSDACGPWRVAASASACRRASACAHENRARVRACASSADRCAS